MPRSRRSKQAKQAQTRLATARQRRGVTQEELAEVTGVPLSAIYKIETGKDTNPRIAYLWNLAYALDVEFEWLAKDWLKWNKLHADAEEEPNLDEFLTPRRRDVTIDPP